MKFVLTILLSLTGYLGFAQQDDVKAKQKALTESKNLTWEGSKKLSEDKFVDAEIDYRRAIAKSDENAAAPYNLGNAYYSNETYSEAFGRFKEAGELATDKSEKHNAYHNMGNVFMKRKDYQKAVEAYKEALRNDPTDEETRYNLALAKEMLKKDQEKNDQNQDNEDKQDKKTKKTRTRTKKRAKTRTRTRKRTNRTKAIKATRTRRIRTRTRKAKATKRRNRRRNRNRVTSKSRNSPNSAAPTS